MSTLALPLVAGKTRFAPPLCVAVHPLLAPKRLLQLALIALVVVPIPSDDGPLTPHAPALVQVKSAASLSAASLVVRVGR